MCDAHKWNQCISQLWGDATKVGVGGGANIKCRTRLQSLLTLLVSRAEPLYSWIKRPAESVVEREPLRLLRGGGHSGQGCGIWEGLFLTLWVSHVELVWLDQTSCSECGSALVLYLGTTAFFFGGGRLTQWVRVGDMVFIYLIGVPCRACIAGPNVLFSVWFSIG